MKKLKTKTIVEIGIIFALLVVMITLKIYIEKQKPKPETYPDAMVVIQTSKEGKFILCQPFYDAVNAEPGQESGFLYRIDEDPEDLTEGDVLAVTMDDRGTEDVKDDLIVEYQYSGWVW